MRSDAIRRAVFSFPGIGLHCFDAAGAVCAGADGEDEAGAAQGLFLGETKRPLSQDRENGRLLPGSYSFADSAFWMAA